MSSVVISHLFRLTRLQAAQAVEPGAEAGWTDMNRARNLGKRADDTHGPVSAFGLDHDAVRFGASRGSSLQRKRGRFRSAGTLCDPTARHGRGIGVRISRTPRICLNHALPAGVAGRAFKIDATDVLLSEATRPIICALGYVQVVAPSRSKSSTSISSHAIAILGGATAVSICAHANVSLQEGKPGYWQCWWWQ